MAEDHARLLALLTELRSQLANSPAVDEPTRRRLEATLGETERALSHGARGPAAGSLREKLNDAALDFETSHPALAGTLGSVIDALAQMGI